MKRCIAILPILFCLAGHCAAAGDARSVLRRTAEYVKSLGSYEASFELTSGDYSTAGSYSVAGDAYYILVGPAEVYSDGKTRYEVDNSRKEITVDEVDAASRNILDNPTRCFDFADTDYEFAIESRDGGAVTLLLRPSDPDAESTIHLTVDESTGRPVRIVYALYDERITVRILALSHTAKPVKRFGLQSYRGYETVDFR